MSRAVSLDLFAEDRAHEELLGPLLRRLAREEGLSASLHVHSAYGGHGRAIHEYGNYQLVIEKEVGRREPPDLVVVAIDGNCTGYNKRRQEIRDKTVSTLQDRLVAACPDPHVERWYLADPQSFQAVIGATPEVTKGKCQRDDYKKALANAIRETGDPAILGGVEFARELAEAMHLYRAAKNDPSLRQFLDDARSALRKLRDDDSS